MCKCIPNKGGCKHNQRRSTSRLENALIRHKLSARIRIPSVTLTILIRLAALVLTEWNLIARARVKVQQLCWVVRNWNGSEKWHWSWERIREHLDESLSSRIIWWTVCCQRRRQPNSARTCRIFKNVRTDKIVAMQQRVKRFCLLTLDKCFQCSLVCNQRTLRTNWMRTTWSSSQSLENVGRFIVNDEILRRIYAFMYQTSRGSS